ncbi:hypothetical protein HK405_004071 [Cladochytrium tenue]|nr:hypothetical protein HK405_004071 [Cladochytrium tenue]
MGADEIFPYVPLHPANQEPRREHRYVIALFKQPSDRIDVDAQRLRERALERIKAAEDRLQSPALFVEDKGDELINTLARSSVSVWGFAKEHNLQLAGYAFVKSSWNVYTPEIFTRLGLHEPVYGRLNPKWSAGATMFRITGATEVAKSLEPGAVPTPATVAALNAGGLKTPTGARTAFRRGGSRAPTAPDAFQLPTRLAQEAEAMRQAAAESRQRAAAKDAARAGKKSKGVAARPPSPVQLLSKLPRVTALGSAGIVRAKETDPARRFVGPLSRRTVDRRGRFQNV